LASDGDPRALRLTSSSEATPRFGPRQVGSAAERAFHQLLLNPSDVSLEKRIGAGAFGEVFFGRYAGQPVAVKTLHKVNEQSMVSFRNEMVTHHGLRHPNVVSMVGACWSKALVALVLEWVPRGSLGDLLKAGRHDQARFSFAADARLSNAQRDSLVGSWDLYLRLAQDVARGMVYLHGRDFVDGSGLRQRCVMHRDLKPDNVLITDFSSAKLADFGVSRTKAGEDAQMTLVGTPLYAAPELMVGAQYDESADVYSFGMLLLDLVVPQGSVSFIGDRWRLHVELLDKRGERRPDESMRGAMRAIWHDGWRPYNDASQESAPGFHLPCRWAVAELVAACCSHDAKHRPSFVQVLSALNDAAAADGPHSDEPDSDEPDRYTVSPLAARAGSGGFRVKTGGGDLRQPLNEPLL
jgi:serine/threonine protein kinase